MISINIFIRVRKNDFGLTLVFSENKCEENGIHISFLTTEKIIINNFQQKVKYDFQNLTRIKIYDRIIIEALEFYLKMSQFQIKLYGF